MGFHAGIGRGAHAMLYSQIAFATLFGWLFFQHVPDGWAWLGIAVIAASGVGNAVLSVYELRKARGVKPFAE